MIVLHGFIKIVNESICKPNKLWVDQGRECYNCFMQKELGYNNILMHSTHSEYKPVVLRDLLKFWGVKSLKNNI